MADWKRHDGSSEPPVSPDTLIGDCDMGTDGVFKGRPIRASQIYWRGVKRYKIARSA